MHLFHACSSPQLKSRVIECSEACKPGKWLKCSDFNESIVTDIGLIGLQVDSFYQGSSKWYDSTCGLYRQCIQAWGDCLVSGQVGLVLLT